MDFDVFFRCTKCDRTFTSVWSLNHHNKRHEEVQTKTKKVSKRIFECDICKKSFTKQENLRSHKKVHKNDPPDSDEHYKFMADYFDMTCDKCDAKFTAFHDARQHYKDVHNGDYFHSPSSFFIKPKIYFLFFI